MLRLLNTPGTILGLAASFVALVTTLVLFAALSQPHLGLRLGAGEDGQIRAVAVRDNSPAAIAGIRAGDPFGALRLADGSLLALDPLDLIEEPDMLSSYPQIDTFLARQEQLSMALRHPAPDAGVAETPLALIPAPARPIGDLPMVFWVQWGVGVAGFLIGTWVLALRARAAPARFLALTGFGLLLSAHAAAIYSTRELALPEGTFRLLSGINQFGALAFGAGMIGLFMVYPAKLARTRWTALPALVLALWWISGHLRLLPHPALQMQAPILAALLVIGGCIALQYRATRADPPARAVLVWFGLFVLIGAGAFVVTVVLPILLGIEAAISQGFAFLFFLPIYIGLALGVSRYRLFDLGDWAFGILFYLGGLVLLLALDAFLILGVALDRTPAFGLALVIVGLGYLPLRDWLARRILARRDMQTPVFGTITDIALAGPGAAPLERWTALLRAEFDPVEISALPAPGPSEVRRAEEGAALEFPAIDRLPALRLQWVRQGKGLFSSRDLSRAQDIAKMLQQACDSRDAYDKGVHTERGRVAQDIHDNIGIQLLGALHAPQPARKDVLIREALGDLRDIISDAKRAEHPLNDMLADLRAALADLLEAAGMRLIWQAEIEESVVLPPRSAHALRSILREAVGNALRHSGGSTVRVHVAQQGQRLAFTITDNGKGGAVPKPDEPGLGLSTMRARAAGLGGHVEITDIPPPATGMQAMGTQVAGWLPLAPARAPRAT
ncbi:MAG: ATP-binding protein [Roseinatronobacter sp.]